MIINVNSTITPISIVVWSPFKFNEMALVFSCLHVHTIQTVPRCGRRQRAAATATFQGQGMCSVDSSTYTSVVTLIEVYTCSPNRSLAWVPSYTKEPKAKDLRPQNCTRRPWSHSYKGSKLIM